MKVNTDELLRQTERFHAVVGRVTEIQDTVLQVTRALSMESTGERFCGALRDVADLIGRQARDVGKLRNALEQIVESYALCENRILDEVENSAVHHQIFRSGVIPIVMEHSVYDLETGLPQAIDWTPWDV